MLQRQSGQQKGLENIVAVVGKSGGYGVSVKDAPTWSSTAWTCMILMTRKKCWRMQRLMLKPWGEVVDLDWKKIKMDFGPPEDIRFSEQKVAEMLKTAGFKAGVSRSVGPYHYLITATKPSSLDCGVDVEL